MLQPETTGIQAQRLPAQNQMEQNYVSQHDSWVFAARAFTPSSRTMLRLPLRLPDGLSAAWRCSAACRSRPRAPAAAASRGPSPIPTALRLPRRRSPPPIPIPGLRPPSTTSGTGTYPSQPLPVGTYNVEVVAKGFQRLLQENVNVDNASMLGLNLKLTVGGENTTITVTDAPPFLNTTDATLGGTIENELYSALPLSMNGGPRDPTAFQYLMPGVQENPANNYRTRAPTAGSSGIYGGTGQTNLNENYVEGVPVSNIAAAGQRHCRRQLRCRSMRSTSSPCRPAARPHRSAAPESPTTPSTPAATSSTAPSSTSSATPCSTPGATSPRCPWRHRFCGEAGRAPEPLRRLGGRPHLQGQALLLRQLRRLPLHQDQQYARSTSPSPPC